MQHSLGSLIIALLALSVSHAAAYCSRLSLFYQKSNHKIIATGLTGDTNDIIGRWDMDTHFTGMRLTLMKDSLCRHYQFCNHYPRGPSSNSDLNFLRCANGGQRIIFEELFIDPAVDEVDQNVKDYESVNVEKVLANLQRFFNVDLLHRNDLNGDFK